MKMIIIIHLVERSNVVVVAVVAVGGNVQALIETGDLDNTQWTKVYILLTSKDEPSHVNTRG